MIELQNVTKIYPSKGGPIKALDAVSLKINDGERLGILGKNGAGKSTLIRLIGGVEEPSSGRIVRNMSVSWPLAFRGAVQNNLSGKENILFIARVYKKSVDDITAKTEEFAELGSRLNDPVSTYSAGMRAKMSFGLSLAVEFDCYLIDEITAVGDKRFRDKCRSELLEKRKDRAIVMVSHNPVTIKEYCNICVALDRGKFVDRFYTAGNLTRLKRWQEALLDQGA
jgi:capsular polysaccharide transport system ATP-binding protein